jgi:ABC-type sugar transport system ATPase subunit
MVVDMAEVLRVENIVKKFPGVLAVDNISLSVEKCEVLAIVGENGAGKSTLTKIICGALQPDSGDIFLDGKKVVFRSPSDAMRHGIAMVFQELATSGGMSAAENIFMNRQPTNRFGFIKRARMNEDAQEYLNLFGSAISPDALVKNLSMGEKQIIEILKAVSLSPKVMILDEPTSSFTENEVASLFKLIRKLKEKGYSFIYITHKLSEIFKIADRVLVIRDGKYVNTKRTDEVGEQDLINMMVGREIKDIYASDGENASLGEEYFKVRNLCSFGLFKNVSFSLRRGEILGIAGLIGAGRTEVASAIAGIGKISSGTVEIDGKTINITCPYDSISAGVCYVTENRKQLGLYMDFSLANNLIAPSMKDFTTSGFMKKGAINDFADKQIARFNIISPSGEQKVINLSGGNQQKCLLAMWMSKEPKVLIFDEPTRGVDIGAKTEIYEQIRRFVTKNRGAIVISSEMPELMGMCDRILVMYHGRISGEVKKDDFSEERILSYASGLV